MHMPAMGVCALTSSVKPGAMMVNSAGPIAWARLTGFHSKNSVRIRYIYVRGCWVCSLRQAFLTVH